jgi:hypothetical protein
MNESIRSLRKYLRRVGIRLRKDRNGYTITDASGGLLFGDGATLKECAVWWLQKSQELRSTRAGNPRAPA